MNIWDGVILAAVALLVIFALRRIKKKKGTCGCGCDSCPHACRNSSPVHSKSSSNRTSIPNSFSWVSKI